MPILARPRKTVAVRVTGEQVVLSQIDHREPTNTACRGRSGDESQDCEYTFNNARRRSNSSTQGLVDFRTKFETVEAEPVFEEQVHGVSGGDTVNERVVTKVESASSTGSESDQYVAHV